MAYKDYVAVRHARHVNGRIIWRLYSAGRSGRPACPLGDYCGTPGSSGLRKIRELYGNKTVEVSRVAPDQWCFRVRPKVWACDSEADAIADRIIREECGA